MPYGGSTYLTADQARMIFAERHGKTSATQMGEQFRVSARTILDIWCGKTWAVATGLKPGKTTLPMDEQLLAWTGTSFVCAEVLENDEIDGLDE